MLQIKFLEDTVQKKEILFPDWYKKDVFSDFFDKLKRIDDWIIIPPTLENKIVIEIQKESLEQAIKIIGDNHNMTADFLWDCLENWSVAMIEVERVSFKDMVRNLIKK